MFKSDLDIETIRKRIISFRERVYEGHLEGNIYEELISIFGVNFSVQVELREFPVDTVFYRARGIPLNDTITPLKMMSHVGDAWEPPSEYVKYPGRLNDINQSILYCCPYDPFLAIKEARASANNFVAIMKYKSIRNILVTALGDYENSNLPKDELTRLYYSFIDEEFAQDVKNGEENRYAITRAVAETFANFPNQDGWYYRSVLSSEKFNLAFLPGKHKDCLKLEGVMIGDLRSKGLDNNFFNVLSVIDFDENTGLARYHEMGSEVQKKLFPEVVKN
ncbi:RES family NAD+ phosphorylase [Acinetobacter baumannii]|uniref:RES family NAD+ phosphorylase n=1 Tax=Acinetobacter baumannii TaxID=470 RepID=UPI002448BB82|nr:RES family NAD+ phosphorylase [Acinetobacter baumannii]MDH1309904.1 RES family NAD+ phosphorylase [Acinetobacter baumannii]